MRVEFENYQIKTRIEKDRKQVFDIVRNKWIILTPEEQVRQIWLHFLVFTLKISKQIIAVEKQLMVNQKIKRFDICVFKNDAPHLLIECKAPQIEIGIPTLEQMSIYNSALKCDYYIITNGIHHFGLGWKKEKLVFFKDIQELFS